MVVRVLVVDDSAFFRKQLTKLIDSDPELKVIDTASNGIEAVEKTLSLKPDVITMDVTMPFMDGITAVKRIMEICPTPILMLSSLTDKNTQETFDTLDAGAVDFFPKRFEEFSSEKEQTFREIREKIKEVAKSRIDCPVALPVQSIKNRSAQSVHNSSGYDLLIIGTSTGGPVALQTILQELSEDFPVPIVVVQHMPASFTGAFAQRLDKICKLRVTEARDGDLIVAGHVFLAPGGKQLTFYQHHEHCRIRVAGSESPLNYNPCIDITFNSAAELTDTKLLALVLTGMGSDGRDGAKRLKAAGHKVWVQEESSCVVPGMPLSVIEAGLADEVIRLHDMGARLTRVLG